MEEEEQVVNADGQRSGRIPEIPTMVKIPDMSDDEESSSADDTVLDDPQQRGPPPNSDFGTPIIDRHGQSNFVDQRLDVYRLSNINEEEEAKSLDDWNDYSRRFFRVVNE